MKQKTVWVAVLGVVLIATLVGGYSYSRQSRQYREFEAVWEKMTENRRGAYDSSWRPGLFDGEGEMNLSDCGLVDGEMRPLANVKSLTQLNLAGNPLTDEAIKFLCEIERLESLDIRGTEISAAGVQRLTEALPDCAVRHAAMVD